MTFDLPLIVSPCTGVCTLEADTRLCAGCLRTAEEIAMWRDTDNTQRLAILQRLKERRRARGRTSAADSRPRRRQPQSV
ncbi:putative Fe-S protein YdhL (DUF1289 family) [Inquilinus ginsengisoli]|uniref:Fe-S protein YdhL (DUF1289 family) n=1 Tax=Inquilinus ginsengisoli TaxID=363840 RepID=A0ABU1K2U9_9PROT|nr:DUF1289 domain-containing protein [Inquilinus ginsengisoli]MDR6294599.1 putative Fe-S protein YdhL (DUF1289 family) [Inquilinus ginsengisoli]